MPPPPKEQIIWNEPLWFQIPGEAVNCRAFLKKWEERAYLESMPVAPHFEASPSQVINKVPVETRTIIVVEDKNGKEFEFLEDGSPINHSMYVGNSSLEEREAKERVKAKRAAAVAEAHARDAEKIEQARLAGDLYGQF